MEDREKYREFAKSPNKYLPIDETGDSFIQSFFNKYTALRMIKNMPIFDKAYKVLTERGNFSREDAFGEMHGDGHIWVEKHPKIQVIVEEQQSFRHIFIKDGSNFHIRGLEYDMNYPIHNRTRLKGITISKFRKQNFVPFCPNDVNVTRFNGFTYGDSRDEGYIFSGHLPITKSSNKDIELLLGQTITCDFADSRTLYAIKSMEFWVHYLNNIDDLE